MLFFLQNFLFLTALLRKKQSEEKNMKIRKILSFLTVFSMIITLSYSSANKPILIKRGTESVKSLSSVNGSIKLSDNCTVNGSITNVNGSITIGDNCIVKDKVKNVNGSIDLGNNSAAEMVSSVNGSIKIRENVKINGILKSVNGSIKCYSGSFIKDNIETVNGSVKLHGTEVDGSIITVNGYLKLAGKTTIKKDIVVKKSTGSFFNKLFGSKRKPLKIKISGNSIIKGDVINKNDDREVILTIESGSKVEGKLINITEMK